MSAIRSRRYTLVARATKYGQRIIIRSESRKASAPVLISLMIACLASGMRATRDVPPLGNGAAQPVQHRYKSRTMGVYILRAVINPKITDPPCRHPPADAAPFVQHYRRMPRIRQPPGAGHPRHACAYDYDEDHAGNASSRIRGMFCLTLKKPAVA